MMVHKTASPRGKAPALEGGGAAAQAWIARINPPLAGAAQGPLAGLRFAAKDNIDVAGVATTAACPALSLIHI